MPRRQLFARRILRVTIARVVVGRSLHAKLSRSPRSCSATHIGVAVVVGPIGVGVMVRVAVRSTRAIVKLWNGCILRRWAVIVGVFWWKEEENHSEDAGYVPVVSVWVPVPSFR